MFSFPFCSSSFLLFLIYRIDGLLNLRNSDLSLEFSILMFGLMETFALMLINLATILLLWIWKLVWIISLFFFKNLITAVLLIVKLAVCGVNLVSFKRSKNGLSSECTLNTFCFYVLSIIYSNKQSTFNYKTYWYSSLTNFELFLLLIIFYI